MPAGELTPVERGVLLILLAEGRPLRESAELKAVHGVALKASHRTKLQRLGLIRSTNNPLTYDLTQKGREWAKEEIGASRPIGQMGMGPLYSLLGGLRRYIDRHNLELQDVFCNGATKGPDRIIREAAWSDADEALGQALQDAHALTDAFDQLQRAACEDLSAIVKRTRLATDLVLQSIRQASRERQLSLDSDVGSATTFDPIRYRSDVTLRPGDPIRVRRAAIVRRSNISSVVVLQGEAEPLT